MGSGSGRDRRFDLGFHLLGFNPMRSFFLRFPQKSGFDLRSFSLFFLSFFLFGYLSLSFSLFSLLTFPQDFHKISTG